MYINKKVLGGGDTVEKLINENKFKDVIPKDCFIRRLDTLKSEYKYLVLTNGKHTQL